MRAILAINKVDLVAPPTLLPLIRRARPRPACSIACSSSRRRPATAATICWRRWPARLPEGPWLFPEDQLSDLSQRAMAAEITREQLFRQLHQELPYSLTVETDGWTASQDGSEVRIDQTIYVQRASQKAIVLGKGGQQIKAVGEAAREELEQMLGQPGPSVPVTSRCARSGPRIRSAIRSSGSIFPA